MAASEAIAFRDIPGHSKLFLDYIEGVPVARSFYGCAPARADLESFARDVAPTLPLDRPGLVRILRRQNREYGAGAAALAQVEDLAAGDAVAVVTGQQAGLFTGPLYTIHKTLTAVALARFLRSHGVTAVPVFWIECEDHDLAEVSRLSVLGSGDRIRSFEFAEQLYGKRASEPRPVGSLMLPDAILDARAALRETLSGSGHLPEAEDLIGEAYQPGAGFAAAFGRALARLFCEAGLVLFNPRDEEAKPLLAPIFRRCLDEAAGIHAVLRARSTALQDAGYHAQVHLLENATLLFLLQGDQRRLLAHEGKDFHVRGSATVLSAGDMARVVASNPFRLSPNVLLRPLVQDLLLPTAAYVGGPAEMAYFAQAEALYRHFDRPMPPAWPRASFTLLDEDAVRSLVSSKLSLPDCFRGREEVIRTAVSAEGGAGERARVAELGARIERTFEQLRPALRKVEPSLEAASATALKKIRRNVDRLQRRLAAVRERDHAALVRQMDSTLARSFPNGTLQERVLTGYELIAREGSAVLSTIAAHMDPFRFVHRVVALNPDPR